MKRLLFFAMAALMVVLAVSCKKNPNGKDPKEQEPSAKTLEANEIGAYSARLYAMFDLAGANRSGVSYGFIWGTSEDAEGTYTPGEGSITTQVNVYSAEIMGLSPETEYWYKALVEIDGKPYSGEILKFTTAAKPDEPAQAVTVGAEQVSAVSAVLTGRAILATSAASDLKVGFQYSKSAEIPSENSTTVEASDLDAEYRFSAQITGLEPSTTYYFRSFIRQNGVDTYGETMSFTTDAGSVESVSLDKTEHTFHTIGNTLTLIATVLPGNAVNKSVEWSSDKTSVATVDQNGTVKAAGNGTATITVTTVDQGKTATCAITVAQWVTSITLSKTTLSLVVGTEETISVTSVLPDNANDRTYTWSSSDNAIASVDQNGKITAKVKGNTVITATANDGSGVSASCAVGVKNPCPAGAVDLGLSVYWATCNLGESGFVSSPESYGAYYAWGETEPKDDYSWSTYKFGTSKSGPFSKYNTNESYGPVDNKTVLDTGPEGDDVASKILGGGWRIPTHAEWTDLRTKCTWTWTDSYNGTGAKGRIVTSDIEGYKENSIFLPAAGGWFDAVLYLVGSGGYYWSSTLSSPNAAWHNVFDNGGISRSGSNRCYGQSIRPVYED